MKTVRCACGGLIAPTWDPISGIARMKCSNPRHGQGRAGRPRRPERRFRNKPARFGDAFAGRSETQRAPREGGDKAIDMGREGL